MAHLKKKKTWHGFKTVYLTGFLHLLQTDNEEQKISFAARQTFETSVWPSHRSHLIEKFVNFEHQPEARRKRETRRRIVGSSVA